MTRTDAMTKTQWDSQWDQYPTWAKVLLCATSFSVLIAARIAWQMWPGIGLCVLFWAISLADEPLRWRFIGPRRRVCYGLAFLGGLGNMVATIANGGFMPVLGKEVPSSLWVPLVETSSVAWLCDIYSIGVGTASLGDLLIGGALLGLLLVWAVEKLGIINREIVAEGKRIPGIGIG